MASSRFLCPVCKVPLPAGSTICPDCKEDLAALVYLHCQPQVLYNEGLRLAQSGNLGRAARMLQQAIDVDGTNADAMTVLGKVYMQQARRAEARTVWERALQVEPGHTAAQDCLARVSELEEEEVKAARHEASAQAAAKAAVAHAARRRSLVRALASFGIGMLTLFLAQSIWPNSSHSVPNKLAAEVAPQATATVETLVTSSPGRPQEPTPLPSPTREIPPTVALLPDLQASVERALQAHADMRSLRVIQDGKAVILVGEVPSLLARYQAETVARAVPGVQLVDTEHLMLAPTYEVQAGDTLWAIATKVYGSSEQWQAIALKNNLVPPYLIGIGQKVVLPSP